MTKSMGEKNDVEDFPLQHCQISICKGRDQRIDEFFHENYNFLSLRPSCFSKVLAGAAIANRKKLHN